MSTYWFPFCKTCNTDDDRCLWWNHGVDRGLHELIVLLPALGTFARALANAGGRLDIDVKVNGPEWTQGLLEFAAKHGDHDVVAKNEYGALDTECGAYYPCTVCHTQKPCTKLKGHEGGHGS